MTKRRIVPLLALLALLPLVAVGCSGGKGAASSVTGKVTYGGQPVTAGNVAFYGADGAPNIVGIQSDGTYTITDIPAGDYTVTVETESAKEKTNQPQYGGKGRGGEAKGQERKGQGGMSPKPSDFTGGGGTYTKIPDKYSKKDTTPLKTTVGKGKTTYDIPLSD